MSSERLWHEAQRWLRTAQEDLRASEVLRDAGLFSPLMEYVGIPKYFTIAAATSSWVLNGLDAQIATSAPPSFSVLPRFAVSVVTWRQQAILTPLSGFSLANRSLILRKTGIRRSAHSIFSNPWSASFMSFTS